MKKGKLIFYLSVCIYLGVHTSCSNDDYATYSYDDPTIYSSSGKVLVSEVILFISPYIEDNGVRKYLIMDNLKNLSLKVNKKNWDQADSHPLDTLHLNKKETIGKYRVSEEKIRYPFAVNVQISSDGFTTAGEYSQLLNNYLNLQPGTYICQIESFDVKKVDGASTKIYTPALSCPLVVEENHASASLGEFEVLVNQ